MKVYKTKGYIPRRKFKVAALDEIEGCDTENCQIGLEYKQELIDRNERTIKEINYKQPPLIKPLDTKNTIKKCFTCGYKLDNAKLGSFLIKENGPETIDGHRYEDLILMVKYGSACENCIDYTPCHNCSRMTPGYYCFDCA